MYRNRRSAHADYLVTVADLINLRRLHFLDWAQATSIARSEMPSFVLRNQPFLEHGQDLLEIIHFEPSGR